MIDDPTDDECFPPGAYPFEETFSRDPIKKEERFTDVDRSAAGAFRWRFVLAIEDVSG